MSMSMSRIVLDGLRGENSIAELRCREGINPNLFYRWHKDFLDARMYGQASVMTFGRVGLLSMTKSDTPD